jgi:dihydroorotate dehydrogenase electron transfer subunit
VVEEVMTTINRGATHIFATVLANKRVGQYHQILLGVGDLVKACKPGNFVAIKVGGDSSRMILRRAFAISRVAESTSFGGTMELIAAPHGSGSQWLCSQPEGAEIDIVAPLGTAFRYSNITSKRALSWRRLWFCTTLRSCRSFEISWLQS